MLLRDMATRGSDTKRPCARGRELRAGSEKRGRVGVVLLLVRFSRAFSTALLLTGAILGRCVSAPPEAVEWKRFYGDGVDIHVVRVDLTSDQFDVVVTRPEEAGAIVSEMAIANGASAAINGDFFDGEKRPAGISIGSCERWESAGSSRRQWVIAVGEARAEILQPKRLDDDLAPWVTNVVSGWPLLIQDCRALGAEELPGSDAFTRAPHPRTAVGLDSSGRVLYLVVADGRREDVPGLTLSALARFMRERLGVCEALNLDGGGSSTLWYEGEVRNKPSDGREREVANHLLVVEERDECGRPNLRDSGSP